MIRKVCLSLPLLAVAVVIGCGPSNKNAPASVSGKVMYKGEALTVGNIGFHFKDKGTFGAPILADGTFNTTDIPAGDAVVTVETESANPNPGGKKVKPKAYGPPGKKKEGKQMSSPIPESATKGGSLGKFVAIPKKYSDPDKSDLRYTLKPGKNEHTFTLND